MENNNNCNNNNNIKKAKNSNCKLESDLNDYIIEFSYLIQKDRNKYKDGFFTLSELRSFSDELSKTHPFLAWTELTIQTHLDELEQLEILEKSTIFGGQGDVVWGRSMRSENAVYYRLNPEYNDTCEEQLQFSGRKFYLKGEELPKKWKPRAKKAIDKENEVKLNKRKEKVVADIFGFTNEKANSKLIVNIAKEVRKILADENAEKKKEEKVLIDLTLLSMSTESENGLRIRLFLHLNHCRYYI